MKSVVTCGYMLGIALICTVRTYRFRIEIVLTTRRHLALMTAHLMICTRRASIQGILAVIDLKCQHLVTRGLHQFPLTNYNLNTGHIL